MAADQELLRQLLVEGISAYASFRRGELDVKAYIQKYGSFFYENDLAGNESGEAWRAALASNPSAVALLERIQDVFNAVYMSDEPLPAYRDAGRLTPCEAASELRNAVTEDELERIESGLSA